VGSGTIAILTGSGDQASFFAVRLADPAPAAVDRALEEIEVRYKALNPSVLVAYEDREASLRAVRILSLMLAAMVVIVGAIAAIGIANTLTMNIIERRREVGIMRAVGAGAAELGGLLAVEASFIGLVGAGVGILAGIPLAHLLVTMTGEALFKLTFTLPPELLLMTTGLALVLAVGASLGPGLLAARLRVGETLRYE
jgi:putative ABC transport system permease protein